MLMTLAGVVFGGTPAMGTPDAHSMPSSTSSNVPPHAPSVRTGRICTPPARPAMPTPLFVFAAMRPATKSPWKKLSYVAPHSPSLQSPSSRGFGSRALPSRARDGSEMKS